MYRCIRADFSQPACLLVAHERSIIICKYITDKFVRGGGGDKLERVGKCATPSARAGSYFINYNEGYTVAEYTRDTTPSCLCSGDRPNLFTPTPGLTRFAEGVNYVQNLRRDAKIIISPRIALQLYSMQIIRFNLIYVLPLFPLCITPVTHFFETAAE